MRWSFASSVGLVALALAACAAPPEDAGRSTGQGVTETTFNKNELMADEALLDPTAFDEAAIQKLFDKTPWGTKSVLATYEDGGKRASKILVEAAVAHGINPLALVVRLQMEQSLVYKTSAPESTMQVAFGCGCPHAPVCSTNPDAYTGFAKQAECAAGTLRRSMDAASSSTGTASGWKTGVGKKTEDDIVVTPRNAATTALYTYTPWVGEAGGGKTGVGGASLHKQVWDRFADNLNYKPHTISGGGDDTTDDDAGSTPTTTDDAGTGTGDMGDDTGDDTPTTTPTPDAGMDAGTKAAPGSDDDGDILKNDGPPPPSASVPPRSKTNSSNSPSSDPSTPDSTDDSPPAASGGCSTSGNRSTDYSFAGIAIVTALVLSRRRR